MRLILTRHAETDKNISGLVYGNLPSKLTKKGIAQVKLLANKLRTYNFDKIYCSDLDRCVETANFIIAVHEKVPIIYTDLLREQKQGSLIGKLVKDVDWHNLPPDVETPVEMATRARRFLSGLNLTDQKYVLIISHRRFLNTFVNVLVGASPEYEDQNQLVKNSSLTIIECSEIGAGEIVQANDVFHLAP